MNWGQACYDQANANGMLGVARTREVISYGIHVQCVSPGSIETINVNYIYITEQTYAEAAKVTGMGRWGKAEEVASMMRFKLLSVYWACWPCY